MNTSCTRLLATLAALLGLSGGALAQDSILAQEQRRGQWRLQGGIIKGGEDIGPLLNCNRHLRFFDTWPVAGFGGALEVGVLWFLPYAELGLETAGPLFNARAVAGLQTTLLDDKLWAAPYLGAAFGAIIHRGESTDIEGECRLNGIVDRGLLVSGAISVNFH